MKRLVIFFSGRVQGVGLRATVQAIARGFEVVGTVQNCPDGRVELIAEGTEAELKAFVQAIEESGLAGLISEREERWEAAEGNLKGFKIIDGKVYSR